MGAAESVVISPGDGTGSTTPPADDFGFENVGVTDTDLGGIYLDDGSVLTASHVGPRPITLHGVTYQPAEIRRSAARVGEPRARSRDRTQSEALTPPLGPVPALPSIGAAALAALVVLAGRRVRGARS